MDLRLTTRRTFLRSSFAGSGVLAAQHLPTANPSDLGAISAAIDRQHNEAVHRLQTWIRQSSIAAENRNIREGCQFTIQLLRDAGFDRVTEVPTAGHPGVFATLDTGAPRTVGLYFMYDVKQADPTEWSSPPWEAALVEKVGFGKVVIGRGATNQKGPQAACLAALHAFRAAGRKLPVNLVLIAEGEEEIGSPHLADLVQQSEVQRAFRQCTGVFMPMVMQAADGTVEIRLGAKGVVELELVSSGERWGRGPQHDIHSLNASRVDSPAWHLVQALATLVGPDGQTPAIEGLMSKVRPLSVSERTMVHEAARRQDEAIEKKRLGVKRWRNDADWMTALEMLASQPTVNIEGLVGGYTGPGGKTILPHQAIAKLDLRLVPDMTAAGALESFRAHLTKHGFGDIEVRMTGGYDPTSTSAEAGLIRAATSVYRRAGIDPVVLPRGAGSWPGYVFTGEPLKLPATHFGLGHGSGAHAPDEYFVVESTNPKIKGFASAVRSYAEYLYELATVS